MKRLLALLILTSCADPSKVPTSNYFTPFNTGYRCLKITHDKTLKECYTATGRELGDIINATNIIKVH